MAKFFEGHPGARWRLILLTMVLPLVVISAVFIWQDYQSRRDATTTEVRLKSAQVNAQLNDFVHTVRGASGVFGVSWVLNHPPTYDDPIEVAVQESYLNQSQGGNYILERWQRHGRCKHQCVGSGL